MEISTLLIISVGVGLGFFVQAVTGFASGLLTLPMLMLIMPMPEAVAMLAILMLLFNGILIFKNWHILDKKIVARMSWGVIPGIAIGVYLLGHVDTEILKKLLGAFILIHVSSHWLTRGKRAIGAFGESGLLLGFVGGISSGLFSGGSPIYAIYIAHKLKNSAAIRATIIGIMTIANLFRVPALVVSDILTLEIAKLTLYSLPVFFLVLYFGDKVHSKLNDAVFKEIVMGLLAVIGMILIVN